MTFANYFTIGTSPFALYIHTKNSSRKRKHRPVRFNDFITL